MSKELKGVYNLNPTSMVMKQGSKEFRTEQEKGMKGRYGQASLHTNDESADFESDGGVEEQVHHSAHPAMQTRHSHPSHSKHEDGRKHEDHHHAVKKMKG
jgi:hypothetical protein